MLASVAAQAISGLFQSDDFLTEGPWHHAAPEWLRDLMHEIHELNLFVLISLITLHLATIVHYRWRLGSDMLQGMITGRRLAPAKDGIAGDRLVWGLLAAAIAAAIVWLVVTSAPQPDPDALFP